MNAVEIEEAVSALALQPFDPAEFPYAFLTAFGNKDTTIKRLRKGETNGSDLPGGVLQRNNIHIAVCASGTVGDTLKALRNSPKTASAKAKFILATDGETLEAEELASGETVATPYPDFARHFGFFLPLAGISAVKEIKNNPIDVKATGRLNKLYVELLKDNPDWATAERRPDMNHFMARLIFCFFAEDTDIFVGEGLFTRTVERMSASDSSNTHEVLATLFRTMDTKIADRAAADTPLWANPFPYVNGGLFSGASETPRFSRIARSYLLRAGELSWRDINPDIFGSMIQAVADDDERGALGMHYTSVPNILKVLNPLFLNDLRAQLTAADDNPRALLNLRKRMAKIRVFDPACGSGNFLVIAYKQMREIEAEINKRRGETGRKSDIPLTNFRGIEIRDFPAEIARLSLIIAEFQCDVLYRGQQEALAEFLPLNAENWIVRGNALRLDWLSICPPVGSGVKLNADDLFGTPLDQAQIDFENEGGETYICGNPPYKGSQDQTPEQKADLQSAFEKDGINAGSADYVIGWFIKSAVYIRKTNAKFCLVTTNSIHQGRQVARFWPLILGNELRIFFAEPSFKWSNLAANKAAVIVSIIGVSKKSSERCLIAEVGMIREVDSISPYLVPGNFVVVDERRQPLSELASMSFGSMPNDGGALLLTWRESQNAIKDHSVPSEFIHTVAGSKEFINGIERRCIWVQEDDYMRASQNEYLESRFSDVRAQRSSSKRPATFNLREFPYRFGEVRQNGEENVIIVAKTSSEGRSYIPVQVLRKGSIVTEAFGLFDEDHLYISLIASRMHLVWIATVCGKMKNDFRYSNTLGWNTFPVPALTNQNKADLTRCAENILLAREAHFPATIADLYDPEAMPDDLRRAHEENDEVLERIYIGRRFRNDTERLETLFVLYTKMTEAEKATAKPVKGKARKGKATA